MAIEEFEKTIKKHEMLIARLARRSERLARTYLTPFPLSVYGPIPPDGIVLRWMFPASGTLIKGCLYLEGLDKSGAMIEAGIAGQLATNSRDFKVVRPFSMTDLGIQVVAGDRLTIRIYGFDEKFTPTGVWVAALWVPEVGESEVRQFMVEELEKLSDKLNKENEDAEAKEG